MQAHHYSYAPKTILDKRGISDRTELTPDSRIFLLVEGRTSQFAVREDTQDMAITSEHYPFPLSNCLG